MYSIAILIKLSELTLKQTILIKSSGNEIISRGDDY